MRRQPRPHRVRAAAVHPRPTIPPLRTTCGRELEFFRNGGAQALCNGHFLFPSGTPRACASARRPPRRRGSRTYTRRGRALRLCPMATSTGETTSMKVEAGGAWWASLYPSQPTPSTPFSRVARLCLVAPRRPARRITRARHARSAPVPALTGLACGLCECVRVFVDQFSLKLGGPKFFCLRQLPVGFGAKGGGGKSVRPCRAAPTEL